MFVAFVATETVLVPDGLLGLDLLHLEHRLGARFAMRYVGRRRALKSRVNYNPLGRSDRATHVELLRRLAGLGRPNVQHRLLLQRIELTEARFLKRRRNFKPPPIRAGTFLTPVPSHATSGILTSLSSRVASPTFTGDISQTGLVPLVLVLLISFINDSLYVKQRNMRACKTKQKLTTKEKNATTTAPFHRAYQLLHRHAAENVLVPIAGIVPNVRQRLGPLCMQDAVKRYRIAAPGTYRGSVAARLGRVPPAVDGR